jgi:putative sterol carrier protein
MPILRSWRESMLFISSISVGLILESILWLLPMEKVWSARAIHASPDITIIMASNDFADMVGGKLDSIMAFMEGKLRLKGDMMLAMQLQSFLK